MRLIKIRFPSIDKRFEVEKLFGKDTVLSERNFETDGFSFTEIMADETCVRRLVELKTSIMVQRAEWPHQSPSSEEIEKLRIELNIPIWGAFGEDIEFERKGGKVTFKYNEDIPVPDSRAHYIYSLKGIVPANIVQRSKKAVLTYVKNRVKGYIAKEDKKRRKDEEFERNSNIPIQTNFGSIILKGRIVSAWDDTLSVRLEEPLAFRGESSVRYGYGAAMTGKCLFVGRRRLSNDARASAKRLLIDIYRRQHDKLKHRKAATLVEELNREK